MSRSQVARVCAVAMTLVLAAVAVASAGQPTVLRLAIGDPKAQSSVAMTTAKFAELATQKSKGTLEVHDFYQSLGSGATLTQSVLNGSVDFGLDATSNLARFTDAFLTLDLPFLFKSDAAVLEFFDKDPAGKKILEQFEKDAGVKVLMWTTHTSTHEINGANISTRTKLLKTPADMKGLKLRTYASPVDMTLFRAWGANPTQVDFAQLYSAVQQGVVDGSSGSTLAAYAAIKLYEVTKFYLALPFKCFMMPLFMNAKKYNSLTPDQQKVLHEAAQESMAFNRTDAVEWVSRALVTTQKAGVTIVFPTPDEYAQWASVRDKVWQDVSEQLKGKIDLTLAKHIKEAYGR